MNATDWRGTLVDPALAGVHVAEAQESTRLVDAATALGFQVARIDLDGCTTKPEALARIAEALGFPSWFGANWDALADALGDLGDEASPGILLVLTALGGWAGVAPDEVEVLLEILDEAALRSGEEGIPFWTLIEAPSAPR
jgi:hypothetical protein